MPKTVRIPGRGAGRVTTLQVTTASVGPVSDGNEHYLHGHTSAVLQAHSARTVETSFGYGRHLLRPGMDVLDLGCGPGSITVGIAGRVAPGRVVAIDRDAGVLATAGTAARQAGLTNIEFAVMDAYHLDVPDESVDLSHAHQVLQHLADPVAALVEMARVTRPGGVVAARDADYAGWIWHPADPLLDRWLELYRSLARSAGGEPDAGRHLLAWVHAAGLRDVRASSSTWTYSTGAGAEWWGGLWAERILSSGVADQAIATGAATRAELEEISRAWLAWSVHPDAWLAIPHGEVLATVE
jgi:ubiquinone/menaquinone biosynthesis C-methylase UbiE